MNWRAMGASFLRVLGASLVAAVGTVWVTLPNHDLFTWSQADWKAAVMAVLGATALTAYNAVRRGEVRFGLGATGASGQS